MNEKKQAAVSGQQSVFSERPIEDYLRHFVGCNSFQRVGAYCTCGRDQAAVKLARLQTRTSAWKRPLRMKAIDMQWSEIVDHEYNVICEVKARYADEVFAVLNAAALQEREPQS